MFTGGSEKTALKHHLKRDCDNSIFDVDKAYDIQVLWKERLFNQDVLNGNWPLIGSNWMSMDQQQKLC